MFAARIELMQQMPIFGAIGAETIEFLLAPAPVVKVPAGGFFFHENDPASGMYVLESGRVTVSKSWQGHDLLLRRLGTGRLLRRNGPADLCRAQRLGPRRGDCSAIELSSANLYRLFERDVEQFALIQMNIGREMSRRLRILTTCCSAPAWAKRWRRLSGSSASTGRSQIRPNAPVDSLVGQRIRPFVARIAGVPLDPAPFDLVSAFRHQLVELLPKFDVLDRLFGRRAPALGLPAADPFSDAHAHVLAVQVERDLARALERAQPFDDRLQFHAVVGGVEFAAEKLLLGGARLEHAPQPPGPGFPLQAPSV
jgi:CRP-like cAMP-binding protein